MPINTSHKEICILIKSQRHKPQETIEQFMYSNWH